MARPTKYNKSMVTKTHAYIDGDYEESGDVLPTLEGLADYLGLATSTVQKWGTEEGKEAFSGALKRLHDRQKRKLLSGGLGGSYNATIAKLVLSANHGLRESSQVDSVSSDGSMTPKAPTTIKLVAGE